MSSPLKNLSLLLSPKFISPTASKLLNTSKCSQNSLTVIQQNHSKRSVRCLDFTPTKLSLKSPIKIHITDCDSTKVEKDLLLNTPNRNKLLKDGEMERKLVNIIGKGTYGTVIRGIYKDKIVAVKMIKKHKNEFIPERNALNLKHENIISTIDIISNEINKYSIIILEYFENSKQLQNLLNDQTKSIENLRKKIAFDICNGLKYCHNNNILHLDLKPKNILICDNCVCKICDFGNSLRINEERYKYDYKGTAMYTAPELLLGQKPSEKCDIFSLGIVLWQLKFRSQPYSDVDNNETLIYKVIKCNLRPFYPKSSQRGIYFDIVTSCWQAEPSQRPDLNFIITKLSLID